jgi:hypothetical protein
VASVTSPSLLPRRHRRAVLLGQHRRNG